MFAYLKQIFSLKHKIQIIYSIMVVQCVSTKNISMDFSIGAMMVALGGSATGVFSSSDISWNAVTSAGYYTGDRMWRFPLWNYYSMLLQGTLT